MTAHRTRKIVLVTGGGGFLGRHCLPLLADSFDEVHATTTRTTATDENSVQWHRVDLLHSSSVLDLVAAIRPTHLLHLAWITEHGHYWNSLDNVRWLDAGVRLVQAFAAWGGQRIVTAGTCAEYDWESGHCHETHTPCAPATLYGACKHALRLAVETIGNLSSAHTRIFHVFGPCEDARRLTPSVIQTLAAERRAPCTQGSQIRDFMYVKDAAAAHVKLLTSNVQGPINVASGEATTIERLVRMIARMLARQQAVDFGALPTAVNDPPVLTADTTRLQKEVGILPDYTLEQGLLETIDWYQACRNPSSAPFVAAA